jgi:ABC-type glycerol-3-phosphate transport system substrate-binding protein
MEVGHMKTKKAFLLIVLILLFAVGAVFAGGAGESTQSEKVNLYFLKHNHPPADAFIPLLVEEYKIKNPGVESIKIESLPDTEYIVKLLTAIASGSGPDLFDLSDGFVPDFRNKKLFAAFDTAAIGAKDQAEYLDKWLPTSLDAWMTSDGKVGGLPFEFNSWQLFINVKHFKEAGLDPEKDIPKTWDELVQVARKLTSTIRTATSYARASTSPSTSPQAGIRSGRSRSSLRTEVRSSLRTGRRPPSTPPRVSRPSSSGTIWSTPTRSLPGSGYIESALPEPGFRG